jgi:hypothetical protein
MERHGVDRRRWKPFRKVVVITPTSSTSMASVVASAETTAEATTAERTTPDSEEKKRRILEALKRDMPGLPLSVDLTREALNQQMAQADSLDTKAGFILGSSSILIALLTAWRRPAPHVWWLSALAYVCVGLAIGGFGWIAWQASKGYALAEYAVMVDPGPLADNVIYQDEKTSRYLTLLALKEAIERNDVTLAAKVKYIQLAFRGLLVETVFVAAVLVLELAFS